MAVESWITPEETPALAAEATALIDLRLAHVSEQARAAFWTSIRKAYNTPYNTPHKGEASEDLVIPLAAKSVSELSVSESSVAVRAA